MVDQQEGDLQRRVNHLTRENDALRLKRNRQKKSYVALQKAYDARELAIHRLIEHNQHLKKIQEQDRQTFSALGQTIADLREKLVELALKVGG